MEIDYVLQMYLGVTLELPEDTAGGQGNGRRSRCETPLDTGPRIQPIGSN